MRNKEYVQNTYKEAALLFELNHKYIIRYRDYYMDEKRIYILLEKMDLSLKDLLNKLKVSTSTQKFSLPDRLKIFRKVVKAVQFCHSSGVIHGDIKPQNILVNVSPQTGQISALKLADFGLAQRNQK